jgi:hypothetical protein
MAIFNNSADLAATTNTTLRTITTGKEATFSVNLCNRTASAINVRLAHAAASGTPANAEWLVYDFSLPANSSLERSALLATAGKNIVAYASTTGISVNVYGFEE